MVEACETIARLVAGKNQESMARDEALPLALARAVEIIGEAAARVSPAIRNRFSALPWAEVIGMRNRLVHAYFDVDRAILWRAVTAEVPQLLEQLRGIGKES